MSCFDGHRVYNGCPDDTMQKRLDNTQRLKKELEKLNASICYFPVEAAYMTFYSYKPITNFYASQDDAILEALRVLKGESHVTK